MRRWKDSSSVSQLSLLFTISSRIPTILALATPFTTPELSLRAPGTCGGNTALSQCGASFPSEFCCPAQTSCLRINGTDTIAAICCPPDSGDCKIIQPINCELRRFNATLFPASQIHIANTTTFELPKCGDKCCPLGYTCNGGTCIAEETEKVTPSASPSNTPSPSSTNSPSASQTSSADPVVETQPSQPEFPAKAVVAGFFPGMVLGCLLTLLFLWVVKKRRESQEKNRYSGDFGHVSRNVSDPIYDPALSARTDFLRRASASVQNSPNSTTGMVQRNTVDSRGNSGFLKSPRIQGLFAKSPKIGTTVAQPPPAFAVTRDPYRTPTRSPKGKGKRPEVTRSGSTETIDVLMPPPSFLQTPFPGNRENRFTQDTQATTFTKLMKDAGYEEESREQVRGWKGSPASRR